MENFEAIQPETVKVPSSTVREAVGVFLDADAMRNAIVELDTHFPRHAISVLGSKRDIVEKFGQSAVPPVLAEMAEDTPLQAPIRPEEKVVGTSVLIGSSAYVGAVAMALASGAISIPAIILAAVVGAGGGAALSSVLAKILGDHYHKDIEDQIEQGGLLLWVGTTDNEQEQLATEIMNKHGAKHVKIIVHDSMLN